MKGRGRRTRGWLTAHQERRIGTAGPELQICRPTSPPLSGMPRSFKRAVTAVGSCNGWPCVRRGGRWPLPSRGCSCAADQVVEQLLDRHPRKPITFTTVDVYAAPLKAGGQHTTPKFENSEAAFDELRYPLETGEIEIVGTPFFRVGDLQGSSRLEMGNQQTIFYTEISSLVPFNDHGELCLIPRDWRAAHGSARTNLRGYRNVLVRSAALVRAFPEERTQLAHVPSDAVVPPPSLESTTVDTLEQSSPDADQSHQTGPATPSRERRLPEAKIESAPEPTKPAEPESLKPKATPTPKSPQSERAARYIKKNFPNRTDGITTKAIHDKLTNDTELQAELKTLGNRAVPSPTVIDRVLGRRKK